MIYLNSTFTLFPYIITKYINVSYYFNFYETLYTLFSLLLRSNKNHKITYIIMDFKYLYYLKQRFFF